MQLTVASVLLALSLSSTTSAAPTPDYTGSDDAYAVCYSLDECYYLDSSNGNSGPFSYNDIAGAYYGSSTDDSDNLADGDENDTDPTIDDNDDTTNDNNDDSTNDANTNGRRDVNDGSHRRPWYLRPGRRPWRFGRPASNTRRAIINSGVSTSAGANTNGVDADAGVNAGLNLSGSGSDSGDLKCCAKVVDASDALSGVLSIVKGDVGGILSQLKGALGSGAAGLNLGGSGGLDLSGREVSNLLNGIDLDALKAGLNLGGSGGLDLSSGEVSDFLDGIDLDALKAGATGLNLGEAGLDLSGREVSDLSNEINLDALKDLALGVSCKAASGQNAQCAGTLAQCSGGLLDIDEITDELGGVVTLGCKASASS